ncbi:MAG: hypothetical protein JO354_00765 [Verrucomicrobia bacterium]|nr:hypothetical protein [Verrucomicrobiota bacterium]
MVDAVVAFLLKTVLALALATFVLAWLAGFATIIEFGYDVYRGSESFDPFGAFAELRELRDRGAFPPVLSQIQRWQRRVIRVGAVSIGVAAVSGILLAVLAGLHSR